MEVDILFKIGEADHDLYWGRQKGLRYTCRDQHIDCKTVQSRGGARFPDMNMGFAEERVEPLMQSPTFDMRKLDENEVIVHQNASSYNVESSASPKNLDLKRVSNGQLGSGETWNDNLLGEEEVVENATQDLSRQT